MLNKVLNGIFQFLKGFVIGFLVITIIRGCNANAETLNLNSKNTVVFRGEVSEESTTKVLLEIQKAADARGTAGYPIYLVIDSGGGDVEAGLSFIEAVKGYRDLRTITIRAASMASAFVEAIPGTRLIIPSGVIMFHRAAGGLQGQFETGELESRLAMIKSIVRNMEKTNAARMSMSLEAYKEKVVNEYWLVGDEAISAKAVDKKIDLVCSTELINAREAQSMCTFFGCVKIEYSGCPLFRYPISVSTGD